MDVAVKRAEQFVFSARSTSSFSSSDAQEFGPELMRISSERGRLTAEDVVEEAAPIESRLHRFFEWDDQRAGHEYRKVQARHMIGALIVTSVGSDATPVRAFYNKTGGTAAERRYIPLSEVLNDETMVEQVTGRFIDDITRLQDDYAAFRAVSRFRRRAEPVLSAVDRTLSDK